MNSRIPSVFIFTIIALGAFGSSLQAAEPSQRRFPAARLSVRMGASNAQTGCSGDFGPTGKLTCGHPGQVSELTWVFLGADTVGDHYRVTRRFPADSPAAETVSKEIVFSGQPAVLWRDQLQDHLSFTETGSVAQMRKRVGSG